MRNLKTSVKFIVSFGIVIVLVLGMSVATLTSTSQLFESASNVSDYETPGLYYLGQIMASVRGERSEMRAMLIAIADGNVSAFTEAKTTLDVYGKTIQDNIEKYKTTVRSDEGKAKLDEFVKKYDTFAAYRDDFVKVCANQDFHAADAALTQLAGPVEDAMSGIDSLLEHRLSMAKDEIAISDRLYNSTMVIIFVVLAVVLLTSVVVAVYLSGCVTKPLAKMHSVLMQVAQTGNMDFSPEIVAGIEAETKYKDELGASLGAFFHMMNHFTKVSEELGHVSAGDLSRGVKALSPQDTMANALNNLLENLNKMFADINVSSNQVLDGSKQIADGAQSLAQGATEQASTVQELSASISEVTDSVKNAADSALNAASLAQTISDRAAQGAEQMNMMMQAVAGIAEASQSIGKVIAVIDQIAFQTNILALNASVEAAHAGERGKGFAVVAEEVRQLASKSAEAAKDTSSMIENSIQQAELGAKIADDTNASLHEIIEGIKNSSRLVAEIARNAEAQASTITQINVGIDQVAQVVQQNSATAEESAAASQEMSSQSQILQELVSRFNLRGGRSRSSSPAAFHPSPDSVRDDPPQYVDSRSSAIAYGKY